MADFLAFPKIGRYSREVIVTEKIDGTNAQVCIEPAALYPERLPLFGVRHGDVVLRAGSRSQWIGGDNDNFGFAAWVATNAADLASLGIGRHYGEWWGAKIQRGYGLSERRFSLFNVRRWGGVRPVCCDVVPELWRGNFDDLDIPWLMQQLTDLGSAAAPGFMRPEGIVIFHTQSGALFKKTYEKDDAGKGREPEASMP